MGATKVMVDGPVQGDEAFAPSGIELGPFVHTTSIGHVATVQSILHIRKHVGENAVDAVAPWQTDRADVARLCERGECGEEASGGGFKRLVGIELQHPSVAGQSLERVALRREVPGEWTGSHPDRAGRKSRHCNGARRGRICVEEDRDIVDPAGLRRQLGQHAVTLLGSTEEAEGDGARFGRGEVEEFRPRRILGMGMQQRRSPRLVEPSDAASVPGGSDAQRVEVEPIGRIGIGLEGRRRERARQMGAAAGGLGPRVEQDTAGVAGRSEQAPTPIRIGERPCGRREHGGRADEAAWRGRHVGLSSLRRIETLVERGPRLTWASSRAWLREPPTPVSVDVDPSGAGPPRFPPFASMAIVGNAPEPRATASAIDEAACVVRFNNAAGFGGRTGSRVTYLALVNRGGQMREWLEDELFLDRPVIRAAEAFILPFPMLAPEANLPEPICWTRAILARLRPTGRPIHILPESLHERARGLLAAGTSGRPNPSTGFLVTLALLLDRPSDADPIQAFGFGFDGWPGHPWAAERAWFERAEAAGRLRLHPVEG